MSKHFPVCLCSQYGRGNTSLEVVETLQWHIFDVSGIDCSFWSTERRLCTESETERRLDSSRDPTFLLVIALMLPCWDLPLCLHCGGGGGLKKREFYRQNRCLIPRLAISRKLLSIQIKVSNLWLQRLPGEAVVHLKSSKWDIRHLKTPPDRCWNMHCQGRIVRLIVLNSFQTERIQQHRYLRFVAVIAYIVVFFVLVRKLWGL